MAAESKETTPDMASREALKARIKEKDAIELQIRTLMSSLGAVGLHGALVDGAWGWSTSLRPVRTRRRMPPSLRQKKASPVLTWTFPPSERRARRCTACRMITGQPWRTSPFGWRLCTPLARRWTCPGPPQRRALKHPLQGGLAPVPVRRGPLPHLSPLPV